MTQVRFRYVELSPSSLEIAASRAEEKHTHYHELCLCICICGKFFSVADIRIYTTKICANIHEERKEGKISEY